MEDNESIEIKNPLSVFMQELGYTWSNVAQVYSNEQGEIFTNDQAKNLHNFVIRLRKTAKAESNTQEQE